ncbi:MAG: polyketide synthase dehydratase domain-containing protein, partial [Planctomycetales bacterium]|nr:polyketide synthase dehydratase domain-containing protein [Planctomycetales bacterium]
PENNVISGEIDAVDEVIEAFAKKGIGTQKLSVSHAFHSPLMDPILNEFEAFASSLSYDRPRIPIVSNRTGKIVETALFDAAYWRDHLRNAVEFADGMETLAGEELHALIEIGPAANLLGMGRRCQPDLDVAWIPSLRKGRDDWETLMTSLAEMYLLGWKIDWKGFDAAWTTHGVSLPNYPFEGHHCWFDEGKSTSSFGGTRGPKLHPLLGSRIPTALQGSLLETRFSADSPKYLQDHVVQGSVVVPGAAYVEQCLAAANVIFGDGTHAIENLSIQQAMFLPPESHRVVQVAASPESNGRSMVETFSVPGDTENPNTRWNLHISAQIVHQEAIDTPPHQAINLAAVAEGFIDRKSHEEFYDLMAARGLRYGPHFQVLGKMERTPSEAIAPIQLADSVLKELDKYILHPVLGDALFQTFGGVVPLEESGEYSPYTYMPVGVRQIRVHRPVGANESGQLPPLFAYAIRTSDDHSPSPESVQANVFLVDADGTPIVELIGASVARVGRPIGGAEVEDIHDWLYKIEWRETPLPTAAAAESGDADAAISSKLSGHFLVLADESGFAQQVANSIKEAGGRATLVRPGETFKLSDNDSAPHLMRPTASEDFAKLLGDAFGAEAPTCQGMIHCWGLDVDQPEGDDVPWSNFRDLTCASAIRLIQQASRFAFKQPPPIWFVTRNAQPVANGAPRVGQTPLWGIGRVAALEHPELKCRLVDLDGN